MNQSIFIKVHNSQNEHLISINQCMGINNSQEKHQITIHNRNQQPLFYLSSVHDSYSRQQIINTTTKANDGQYIQAVNEEIVNLQQNQKASKLNNSLKKQRRYWNRQQKQIYVKCLQQIYQEIRFKKNKLSKNNLKFIANSIEKNCYVKRSISSVNHFHNTMIKHYQTIDFIISAFKHDQNINNHDEVQINQKQHRIQLKINYGLIDCCMKMLNFQTQTNQSANLVQQNNLPNLKLKIIYMQTGSL